MKTAKEYADQAARFAYLAGANQVLVIELLRTRNEARKHVPDVLPDFRNRQWWTHATRMHAEDAARAARARDVERASREALRAARDAELAAAFALA